MQTSQDETLPGREGRAQRGEGRVGIDMNVPICKKDRKILKTEKLVRKVHKS